MYKEKSTKRWHNDSLCGVSDTGERVNTIEFEFAHSDNEISI